MEKQPQTLLISFVCPAHPGPLKTVNVLAYAGAITAALNSKTRIAAAAMAGVFPAVAIASEGESEICRTRVRTLMS